MFPNATTSTLIQSGGYYSIQNPFCEVLHITKLIICVEVMCRFHRVLDVSAQAVDQYPWDSLHCDDQIMGSVQCNAVFSMLLLYLSSKKLHFTSSVWLGAVFLLLRWFSSGIDKGRLFQDCSKNSNITARKSHQYTQLMWYAVSLMINNAWTLMRQLHNEHFPMKTEPLKLMSWQYKMALTDSWGLGWVDSCRVT